MGEPTNQEVSGELQTGKVPCAQNFGGYGVNQALASSEPVMHSGVEALFCFGPYLLCMLCDNLSQSFRRPDLTADANSLPHASNAPTILII